MNRSALRTLWFTVGVIALLGSSETVRAGNILRPGGAVSTPDNPAAQAAAQAAQAAAKAQALAQQANNPLRQALDAIRQWQAAQDAARAAAQAGSSTIPNGLAAGGLEIAAGTPPSGATIQPVATDGGRTEVTITQDQQRAILTWKTFNVGSQTDVHFDQTAGGSSAASWVALNRVLDPSGRPTQILGTLKAEGQIYIINRNGVIFGGNSQVNAGTLLASGLELKVPGVASPTDLQYADLFRNTALYNLSFSAPSRDQAGVVTVEAGAKIAASGGGRVVMVGGEVHNGGSIEAPDGQVFLAAGTEVVLKQGDLVNVRGLAPPDSSNPVVDGSGLVENTGVVSADRGNIIMVGGETRQDGMLTATTGAQANGTIYLGADGYVTTLGGASVTQILPDTTGPKVIGTGSDIKPSQVNVRGDQIRVLDGASIYAPAGSLSLSAVMTTDPTGSRADDSRVYIGSGARLDVSGLRGVEVAADRNSIEGELRANELKDSPLLRDNPALRGHKVWFDARQGVNPGVADLSGYYDLLERDVSQFMTRGGTLSLAANSIIARQGSVMDLSGGSLSFQAGLVKSSVLIDPAGRRVPIEQAVPGVAYVGIAGDFTVVHPRWGVVDIHSSPLARVSPHWEPGYVQGGSAGTLSIGVNTPTWFSNEMNGLGNTDVHPPSPSATGAYRVFDGQVKADTIVGPKQREAPTGSADPTQAWRQQPLGGTLSIGQAGDVTVAAGAGPELGGGFGPNTVLDDPALRYRIHLPEGWFNGSAGSASPTPGVFRAVTILSGFDPNSTNTSVGDTNRARGGHLTVAPGVVVDLGDRGSFAFTGTSAEIGGTILAPGGKVTLSAQQKPGPEIPGAAGEPAPTTIHLASTGVIDVAGRLTNDFLDGSEGPIRAMNGGAVSLTGPRVLLDAGSVVDVSGGGQVSASGKKLTAGNGGSITIDASRSPTPSGGDPGVAPPGYLGTLLLGGTLSGYALGTGGKLSIRTGYDVVIGDALPAGADGPTYRLFTPTFFTHGGFSSYEIAGARSVTLVAGTVLAPSTDSLSILGAAQIGDGTLSLSTGGLQLPTGTRLDDVLARQVLPEQMRRPMTLGLSTLPSRSSPLAGQTADVVLEPGSVIQFQGYPGSTVSLGSAHDLDVGGTINAPGGAISLATQGTGSTVLGPESKLLAPGYQDTAPAANNGVRRQVERGGTISIASAGAVRIDPGAELDVSGVSGFTDLDSGAGRTGATTVAVPVDGSAGAISVSGTDGVVGGKLHLAPGGPGGLGGALTISLAAGGQGAMIVTQASTAKPVGPGLTVVADAINSSGADDLTLQVIGPKDSPGRQNPPAILFDGDVSLGTNRSMTLVSPILGTYQAAGKAPRASSVRLSSSHVDLQGMRYDAVEPIAAGATDLLGTLTVQADLIDVSRTLVLGCVDGTACHSGGFDTARLVATGDIRLSDRDAAGNPSAHPGLLSSGSLALQAAQVYVTSRAQTGTNLERTPDDPGFLVESAQSITVAANGNPAPVPLAFGERLTLRAPVIDQAGILRAPQGQIVLEGTGPNSTVTLENGSLTSTSLEGAVVPFGPLQTGGTFLGYDQPGEGPSKSVQVKASNASLQKGAVVDVSGGGDLSGFIWTPGNGGSRDILATGNAFAILPSLGTAPAPIGGTVSLRDPNLKVGDTVWLQGVPGLPDGSYTMLPAHYALLPGGLLVVPLGGFRATPTGTSNRPDGSVVASGYEARSGSPGYGQFLVMTQDVFGRYSQLTTYSFDQFARDNAAQAGAGVRTPADAGTVSLGATSSLALAGTGRFGAGKDGLLGNLDVSAPYIAVIGAGESAPTDHAYVTVDPQALMDFGAGSVLLGGTRIESATTALTVNATRVFVNTGGRAWTAPEILLAATDTVTVADGSVIQARAGASGTVSLGSSTLRFLPPSGSTPGAGSDGAFLRLSVAGRVPLVRPGATGTSGDLVIGAATLSADGSVSLDGSRGIDLAPRATLVAPQLAVASTVVNLGEVPAGTAGLTLGTDKLAELSRSSDLLIRGYNAIGLYGNFSLGNRDETGVPSLGALTLDSGLLQGQGASGGGGRIVVGDLTLQNSGGGSSGSAGSGPLALDVDRLHLGSGSVRIAGVDAVRGTVGLLEARGTGRLDFAGDLTLAVGLVTTASGVSYDMTVGGSMNLARGTGPEPDTVAAGLGGQLSLQASTLAIDTSVLLPAGSFQASTTGGALHVGPGAAIDVRGRKVTFGDQPAFAPGGSIQLAGAGDVVVASGASLDVSGDAAGGDAGTIDVRAAGNASIQGTLVGRSAEGKAGGTLSIDAAGMGTSPTELSALLAMAGKNGFDTSLAIRLRQQGITLGANDGIRAHEVILRSDAGTVAIAGEIQAAGSGGHAAGGTIELEGGSGVSIQGTATLDARATAPGAQGGHVEIAATGGRVDLAPGSRIDVSGGKDGGGVVVVRAPRDGADVAVDRLGSGIVGAREVVVQGVQAYAASTIDATLAGQMTLDGAQWLQGAPAVLSRLIASNPGLGSLSGLQVAPGILVRSAGDLTVATDLDLSTVAKGSGSAGYLGLVASGSIDVKGAVSDGFASGDRTAQLLAGGSFSYDLRAGRDVILEPGALLRTGTGRISVEAGRDLTLADTRAVVYTAGARAATPGFSGAPAGMPLGEFPTGGGDIEIRAGRDVVAPQTQQTTSAWLLRYGDASYQADSGAFLVNQPTSWSVYFPNFEQGVGALGGGDVRVIAARDIVQLPIAVPTTGYLTTSIGAIPSAGDLVVRGGGDLLVSAGRDIRGGLLVLGKGHATVLAGGIVGPGITPEGLRTSPTSAALGQPRGVGLLLGLMDSTATVEAGSDVLIEGVFDPMRQGQIAANLQGTKGTSFSGYGDSAGLDVTSSGGTVRYESDPWASVDVSRAGGVPARFQVSMGGAGTNSMNEFFSRAPPTLRLASLGSSVYVEDPFGANSVLVMASAPTGSLDLLAARDVHVALAGIRMEEIAPRYVRGSLAPMAAQGDTLAVVGGDSTNNFLRGLTPVHAADVNPVRIQALQGSVCVQRSGSCTPEIAASPTLLSFPKPIEVVAGRDVVSGIYQAQNNGATDVTSFLAGRDINQSVVEVMGTGAAVLQAGHDVLLRQNGFQSGGVSSLVGGSVISMGNRTDASLTGSGLNLALPAGKGADVYILAGAANGMNYDGFASAYLDPANGQGVARTYLPELATYMTTFGKGSLTGADLVQAFQALSPLRRQIFLDQVYFAELKQTGIDHNDPSSAAYQSYDRGLKAVTLLFPADPTKLGAAQRGDVILNAKQAETQSGASINVLAPYGGIQVGTDLVPAGVNAASGGLVTRRGGDIHVMADQDISLFTSRVFTLEGGDILMWTTDGSITAGTGSKTSVLQVPLRYLIDNAGVVSVDAFGLATGAGIGVLDALQNSGDRKRSRLDLIAPRGEVNAGDAGIRVVGDINIAAAVIVGVDNIQVTGSAVGVPKVEAPSVASLTTASQLSAAATQEGIGRDAVASRNAVADLPSIVTVEAVGYETTKKSGEEESDEERRRRTSGGR